MRNISYPNGGNQYQRNMALTQQMYNAVVQANGLWSQENELKERRKEPFNPKNPFAAVNATINDVVIFLLLAGPGLLSIYLFADKNNPFDGLGQLFIRTFICYLVLWIPVSLWALRKAPKVLESIEEYNNSLNRQIRNLEKQRVQHVLVLEKLDLPQRYRNEDALNYIYNLFVNRRAGSFQEAFNIYENGMRANSVRRSQEQHNAQVRRQLANQSRQANRNAEAIRNEIYWNNRRF